MQVPEPDLPRTIAVTSPDFADGMVLPTRFSCAGEGVSPAFAWSGVPTGSAGLAVVVHDPDAPRGTFVHWLVTGLAPTDGSFPGGSAPPGAREWPNSGRSTGWVAPCPPSGTHRYVFAVHALDAPLRAASSQDALEQIGRHTVAWGTLTGRVTA